MSEYKQDFSIVGMTCAMCARSVEKELNKIESVTFAAVNLATETGFLISNNEILFEDVMKAVEKAGYKAVKEITEDIEKNKYKIAKINLIIALILTIPISILMLLNMYGVKIPYFYYLELIIAAAVIFYCGRSTIKGAWIALIHFHTNMDTLIFLGSVFAWLTTLLFIIGMPIASFGTIGAMIVAIHITGRFIESFLRDKASKEIKSLFKLQTKEARVIFDKVEKMIPLDAVKLEDIVVVRPGDRIPVDGIIDEGISSVDESMITGESLPVKKTKDSIVTGGSLNLTGILKIKTTKVGKDSFLSQMMNLIQEAQGSKIPIQALADRITMWFVPTIIMLALFSGLVWYFGFDYLEPFLNQAREIFPWIIQTNNPLSFAVFVFVATMVIACPCALGLATPMALITGTGIASKNGLLIRNAEAIQTSKDVKTVIMDKTGTLTKGKPEVIEHTIPAEEIDIISCIEKTSNHPLATAISKLGNVSKYKIEEVEELSGKGVLATVNSAEYFIGKPVVAEKYNDYYKKCQTVVEVNKNKMNIGYIVISDSIREDSALAVKRFKENGITPVIATGDNKEIALAVAQQVGIDKIYAGIKPEEKLDIVRKYQSYGTKVLMVGDGMNDAAALKAADIGVAIGSGMDLAIDNADIVIVKGGLSKIADVTEISHLTFKTIKQNLFGAFIYNIIAIPMAMAGLLHPAIAEVSMALSSITVVLNSLRIKSTYK
jgi:P-type Cu+ transporter